MAVRAALVIPRDYPAEMDWGTAANTVRSWVEEIRSWLGRETGYTFDFDFVVHHSRSTLSEMAAGKLNPCAAAPLGYQGLDWGTFRTKVVWEELGWGYEHYPYRGMPFPDARELFVVLGGGGWDGANQWTDDWGHVYGIGVQGDWGLRYAVTGIPDACCVAEHDTAFCGYHTGAPSLGHETLHAMGVNADARPAYFPGTLTDDEKATFINKNPLEIYPAPSWMATWQPSGDPFQVPTTPPAPDEPPAPVPEPPTPVLWPTPLLGTPQEWASQGLVQSIFGGGSGGISNAMTPVLVVAGAAAVALVLSMLLPKQEAY